MYFADSSSGLGALGFHGSSFLIQLITFILAYLVLSKYAFKPIIKILNQRKALIEEGVSLGEQMKKDKQELDESVEKALVQARIKADAVLSEAEDTAKKIIAEAENKAKDKSANILKSAEEQLKREEVLARSKLEHEVKNLIAMSTEAIIKQKIDPSKDSSLIESAMAEASK